MRRALFLRWLTAGSLAAASAGFVSDRAEAYCRSTTCAGDDCPRDDDECKTSGEELYWPGLCVGFSMDRRASDHIPLATAREVVQKGFAAWSDIECEGGGYATIAFSELDDVDCQLAEYVEGGPNANVIIFQDYRWGYTGTANTLAKTTVTYDTDTGEIFDADIELNHAYNEFTIGDDDVVYDLQSIVTHEVGHFIGLDHTQNSLATMNAGYAPGSTDLRTIESDDAAAACDAYPPDRDVTCSTQPKGGLATVCGEELEEEGDGCSVARQGRSPLRAWALVLGLGAFGAFLRRRGRLPPQRLYSPR
jgi:hypothetical protein